MSRHQWLDRAQFLSYNNNIMNWDWEKLQEKRHQQGWSVGGRGKRGPDPNGQPNGQPDGQSKDPSRDQAQGQANTQSAGQNGRQNGQGDRGLFDSNREGDGNAARRQGHGPTPPRPPHTPPGDPGQNWRGIRIPGGKWWFLICICLWLLSGIYIVQPDEAGVILRFGKYDRTTWAGPHYRLPYPIEEVYKPKIMQIRQAEVGYRSQSAGGTFQQGRVQAVDEESAMLTGDENIVHVQFNIQYHLKPEGAVQYLFNVHQPDSVVKKAAEAAMREIIGKNTLDAALTSGRVKIQDDVTALLQQILDRYQVGVQVVAVQMQNVQPPYEVRDAFKDVASAREDRERLINEAEAYRRDILPKAQGAAAQVINEAEAYKQTRIRMAEGETRRFLSILAEYEKAAEITRQRLLFETLEEVLSKPGLEKLILPENVGNNVLPLLPLGEGSANLNAPRGATVPSLAPGLAPASQANRPEFNMQNPLPQSFSQSTPQAGMPSGSGSGTGSGAFFPASIPGSSQVSAPASTQVSGRPPATPAGRQTR